MAAKYGGCMSSGHLENYVKINENCTVFELRSYYNPLPRGFMQSTRQVESHSKR